jgi:hypothetical protein
MTPRTGAPRRPEHAPPFYERVLSETDRQALGDARDVRGLDEEIALLRLRLRDALASQPEDLDVLLSGVRLLIQALVAQHRLSGQQADDLSESLLTILETFGAGVRGIVDASN